MLFNDPAALRARPVDPARALGSEHDHFDLSVVQVRSSARGADRAGDHADGDHQRTIAEPGDEQGAGSADRDIAACEGHHGCIAA